MSALYLTGLSMEAKQLRKPKQTKEAQLKPIQGDYLEFLIEQETSFANIEVIKDFYISQLHLQQAKHNANKSLLQEKEEDYTDIIKSIEREIIVKYDISYEKLISYYNEEIAKAHYLIRMKEDELRRYNNVYNRLYHCNFMIKKRVINEKELQEISSLQFPQFQRQNYHAFTSMSQKKNTLKKMKRYNTKVQVKTGTNVEAKEIELNGLLGQVDEIKKDIIDEESRLSQIFESEKAISNEVATITGLYQNNYRDYLRTRRDYHKANVNLLLLLSLTQTKNIQHLINESVERKIDYQNVYSPVITRRLRS